MVAGEDLHQRGFARAVVADQRDYLAGVDFSFDIRQRGHRAKMFRDVAQLQYWPPGGGVVLLLRHTKRPQSWRNRARRGGRRGKGYLLMPNFWQAAAYSPLHT